MIKVIAELGINHESSLDTAKKLIDAASTSSCWAIKFQYRNLRNFYSSVNEIGDELIHDQLKDTHLNLKEIKSLTKYARKKGLKVGISFFSIKDFREIISQNIEFDFYKIPSAEFSNTELVKETIESKKLIILSTGGHDLKAIKSNIKKYQFNKNAVIMHCTSNYPTEIGSQNLNTILELKKIKNIEVGYSSHDINYEVVFLAASLGAKYIERHITLNKKGKSLDDSSSSEPDEFISINKVLKNYDQILGSSNKPVNQGEILNLQNLGTSAYSKLKLEKNEFISLDNISILAPRKGLTLDELNKYIDKPLTKQLNKNEPITKSHFIKSRVLNNEDFDFMDKFKLSIPIRFHDMESIFENFNITNYEFHLSYQDIENIRLSDLKKFKKKFKNKNFTFHLPDYLNNYQLFDPLSLDPEIKKKSFEILNKVISFSQLTSDQTQIFVSSLSQNDFGEKDKYYLNLKKFIDNVYKKHNILFLPQWLPKKAWYFGGSYDINLFSTYEDIQLIRKHNILICLDIAHLIMSANFSNSHWNNWFTKLIPITRHIHLSDSYGTDGEGVEFGKGELGYPYDIMNTKYVKVLEVWQGHLDGFQGFKQAVKALKDNY
tara:strand:+ start:894 stop:2705 length:1812 start_codon:yes stop_codon:yes gene_type:complete